LIINRYLAREIALPLVTVTTILIIIFMSYNAAVYTAEAAAGLLPATKWLPCTPPASVSGGLCAVYCGFR
jgi:hypothetical protein